ncbi:hypothetical protein D9M72_576860 [compost metagenome]
MRDGRNLPCRNRPVLAALAVAAADCLGQQAAAVNQGHRHAIDFRLDPDVDPVTQPFFDGGPIMQFAQSGVGDGMGQCAPRSAQGVCGRVQVEAVAPLGESRAGLVVEFIGDQ